MRFVSFARALISSAVLLGCSVDYGDVFSDEPSGAGGSGGDGGSSAATTSGPASSTSGGGTSTTGSSTSASAGATTGSTASATGATTGAGATSSTTAAGTTSAATTGSGTPTGPTVYCAGSPCNAGEICCFNYFNDTLDRCDAPGMCGPTNQWLEVGCNGPDDCNGGVCCGTYSQQYETYVAVQCKPQCGFGELVMCFSDPGACPPGTSCQDSGKLGDGNAYCN
jgi:hypothetical protein